MDINTKSFVLNYFLNRSLIQESRGLGECEGEDDRSLVCNGEPCPDCVIDGVVYTQTELINQTDCKKW